MEKALTTSIFFFSSECFQTFSFSGPSTLYPRAKELLDLSESKAFADDNKNMTQKLKFASGRVENKVGKGENAGNQHFLLFPLCFQMPSYLGKFWIVW